MMLGLESTDSWMSHIARNEIYYGRSVSTEEICQSIRAVSRDDVVRLADSLFRPETMTLTLLGAFKDGFKVPSLVPHN
jgi:predicted Zn-dependent peptidase